MTCHCLTTHCPRPFAGLLQVLNYAKHVIAVFTLNLLTAYLFAYGSCHLVLEDKFVT